MNSVNKSNSWIEVVRGYLPLWLLGWVVTDLRMLYDAYFGRDVVHVLIVLLLVLVTIIVLRYRGACLRYRTYVFLLMVIAAPHALNYLHRFPNYVSTGYYVVLPLLTWLSMGDHRSDSRFSNVWYLILAFLMGLVLHELLPARDWLSYAMVGYLVINFYWVFRNRSFLKRGRVFAFASLCVLPLLAFAIPKTHIATSQGKYYDPVVLSQTTPFQRLDVTEWKGNWWYYLDGVNVFSSVDYWMYYEPLIHPAMGVCKQNPRVLVVGGENGIAVKELLKHRLRCIDMVPLDTALVSLCASHPLFTRLNGGALRAKELSIKPADVFHELGTSGKTYDLIVIDTPDPRDIITNQYYTTAFYRICAQLLTPDGIFVTQSGSPYFASQAFGCIDNTLRDTGFETVQIHNQILTTGEWGWTIASLGSLPLDSLLQGLSFDAIDTQWLNSDAMQMMMAFGKRDTVKKNTVINTMSQPKLYKYYNEGNFQ